MNYKIIVLGPIPRDRIITYERKVVEKYGCVLYPVVALSQLSGSDSEIIPVTHIQKKDSAPIKKLLAPFSNVNLNYINSDLDRGDVISLNYIDQNKRKEYQTGFMSPILPCHVEDLMSADAFVFVPVTDFEIALDTLKYIKKNSSGVIVFDAHGPTNSCTRKGERIHRFWIDRDQWLPYIDILKMNLEEAACSWYKYEYTEEELSEDYELPLSELPKFAKHCLDRGVKAVYITLDEQGCVVYFKNEKEEIEEHFVKRINVENVVDTTGCGDSFAGGLAFGFLKTNNYIEACYYANAVGAQRCHGTELNIYKSLAETEQQIKDNYGET